MVLVLAIRTYTHRCLNVCVCACTEPNLLEGKICRPADILLNPPGFRISHTFYTCIRISRLIVDHAYVTFSAESKFRRVRNLYPPVRVCQCECVDCVQLPYSLTCVRECVWNPEIISYARTVYWRLDFGGKNGCVCAPANGFMNDFCISITIFFRKYIWAFSEVRSLLRLSIGNMVNCHIVAFLLRIP